jgi:hypothetical protein
MALSGRPLDHAPAYRWSYCLAVLAVGCATSRPPSAKPASPVQVAVEDPVKLAWFPAEAFAFADVAEAANVSLERARVPGVDSRFKAPVSMEVAQLSLECIEQSDECWVAVGRSLEANRLLWADLSFSGDKKKAIVATVVLFDVDDARVVSRAQRSFGSRELAIEGLDSLVQTALAVDGRAHGPAARAPQGAE